MKPETGLLLFDLAGFLVGLFLFTHFGGIEGTFFGPIGALIMLIFALNIPLQLIDAIEEWIQK